ncbi:hypothetical protein [Streptomyces iconiensis]|uniref:Uncharacterized protein n=1 Tax=Streptomyces iconiensis TaxID=1384038 RepID=A0ABT7ABA0_9ACTN|nr:hypothetical protein [Streptomyces iconiensis]MDJ1138101.1 hypothetical protein [Streptomyces iconiensis]
MGGTLRVQLSGLTGIGPSARTPFRDDTWRRPQKPRSVPRPRPLPKPGTRR